MHEQNQRTVKTANGRPEMQVAADDGDGNQLTGPFCCDLDRLVISQLVCGSSSLHVKEVVT